MSITPITSLDIFYLSYHEPYKEKIYNDLKSTYPSIKRIDGVKGFDEAYKMCARSSTTDNFVVIDGDNIVKNGFFDMNIPTEFINDQEVISFSAKNTVNNLEYGYGGIKVWPKNLVLDMKTHEKSELEESLVDFCFTIPYRQMHSVASNTWINQSPLMAFRSGFRENIKMNLSEGRKINIEDLHDKLFYQNYRRSQIWMSVGIDVEYGIYTILGAKIAFLMLYKYNWDYSKINESIEIQNIFIRDVSNLYMCELTELSKKLTQDIQEISNIVIADLDEQSSIFFKETFMNPLRTDFEVTEDEYKELIAKRTNHVYIQ